MGVFLYENLLCGKIGDMSFSIPLLAFYPLEGTSDAKRFFSRSYPHVIPRYKFRNIFKITYFFSFPHDSHPSSFFHVDKINLWVSLGKKIIPIIHRYPLLLQTLIFN